MAQVKTRTKYWKFSNNKWMLRQGIETQAQAQARANADQTLLKATVPLGAIKDGGLDVCNNNEIRGWVASPFDDASTYADIWIGGVVIESVYANQPRQDVADYYGITTSNQFGFTYLVPVQYRTPGVQVRVTLKGRTDDVENSPRLMESVAVSTVPQTTTTTVPVTTSTTSNGSTTVPVSTTSTSTTTQPQTTLNQNALDTAAGPKPFYSGQIDWANSLQGDTNFLDIELVEVNSEGLIRLRNKAPNRNPDNGRTGMYHVSTNKHMNIGEFESRWFEPFQELVIEYFWADLNVPGYAWEAEHQPYNFFKADAVISFK